MPFVVHDDADVVDQRWHLTQYVKELLWCQDQYVVRGQRLEAEQLGHLLQEVELHRIRQLVDFHIVVPEGVTQRRADFMAQCPEWGNDHREL